MSWDELSVGHKATIRSTTSNGEIVYFWVCECWDESNDFFASHQGAAISHTAHVKRAWKMGVRR